jgi:alpha-1,2-mannosyltransferase
MTSRRRLLDALWIFLASLTVYLLTAGYGGRGKGPANDVAATYGPASELAHHGSVFMDRLHGGGPWIVHLHGHYATNRFPGSIFWSAPFYLFDGNPHGTPTPYAGAVAAAVSAAMSVALCYFIFARLVRRRAAVLATLVAATCTSTWSVSADQIWTHGPGQMVLLAAVLAVAAGGWWLAGICFGAAVMVRPHLGVAAAALGLYLGCVRRQVRVPLRIALASLPGVGGLLLYNRLVFGSWSVLGGYAVANHGHASFAAHWWGVGPLGFLENVAGTAVSPGRGIFLYSPFLVMLIPGLRSAWRQAPDWVRGSALAGAAYLAAQLYLNRFSGGTYFYGYRLPIESLTLAAPLLLGSYSTWVCEAIARRRVFMGLALASFAVQLLGAFPFTAPIKTQHPWTSSDFAHVLHVLGPTESVVVVAVAALAGAAVIAVDRFLAHRDKSTTAPRNSDELNVSPIPATVA